MGGRYEHDTSRDQGGVRRGRTRSGREGEAVRVLVACEFSGIVRDAFRSEGHDAWSCDLLPSERVGPHIMVDVLDILGHGWDLLIAHPPCTYLAVSGAAHFHKPGRREKQDDALAFFSALLAAPIQRIAVENPIGVASTRIRKPDQIIQPWMFGHAEQKSTCLWLQGLPPLMATDNVQAAMAALPKSQRERIHYLSPSPNRWKIRSRTFQGIAAAMAAQWGAL